LPPTLNIIPGTDYIEFFLKIIFKWEKNSDENQKNQFFGEKQKKLKKMEKVKKNFSREPNKSKPNNKVMPFWGIFCLSPLLGMSLKRHNFFSSL
jgi:cytoskeletal protein RodZ